MKSDKIRISLATALLLSSVATTKHLTLPIEPRNFTTRVDFGSNADRAQLQLSMQSDWTFVMGSPEREKCPSKVFRHVNSTSWKNGTHAKNMVEIGKQSDKVTLEGFSS